MDYDLARQCISKHFDKGLSFSTTPLEVSSWTEFGKSIEIRDERRELIGTNQPNQQGDEVYLQKSIADEAVLPLSLTRHGDETPRISSANSDRSFKTGASDSGW